MRSLDRLTSVPTITSTPPPPPAAAAFCLPTFQRMQPSSCSPPRPLLFHSPAGYGALPIPPSRLPLPPRLTSVRYISIMTTISIATSQPPGREELVWLCVRLREEEGCEVNKARGSLTPACSNRQPGQKVSRIDWHDQGLQQKKKIKKNPEDPSQSQHCCLCFSTSSIVCECVVSSFHPVSEPTVMHLFPSASLMSHPLEQIWHYLRIKPERRQKGATRSLKPATNMFTPQRKRPEPVVDTVRQL